MAQTNFWTELWKEWRPMAKLMVGHGLFSMILIGLIAAFAGYHKKLPLPIPESQKILAEHFESYTYLIVWGEFLAVFLILVSLFIVSQLRQQASELKFGGVGVNTAKFEAEIQTEITGVVDALAQKFTSESSAQVIPPSDETVARHVHVIEFLDAVGVEVPSSGAWEAVGNYYFNKDKDKALRAYEKAMKIDPKNPSPYKNRGFFRLTYLGNGPEAGDDFAKAIELESARVSVPWAYVGMAMIHRRAGDENGRQIHLKKARERFESIVKANPLNAWAHQGLAYCHRYLMDNLAAALDENNKAIELDGSIIAAYYNRACYLALKGRKQEALANLRKMVSWVAPSLTVYAITTDADLVSLKDEEPFKQFLAAFGLSYSVPAQDNKAP